MSTELERYEDRPVPSDLAAWARSAQAASVVAAQLVRTSFVPTGFRGKPDEATAAILSGAEVGLSPMASLRAFDVINGTAAPRAITLRAIVQSAGHEFRVEESTPTRAAVVGRRKNETVEQTSVWTIERAHQLGVTGKDNWKLQPQAMLLARATSELCRLIAADAILGIPYYSLEELGDVEPTRAPQPAAIEQAHRRAAPRAIRATPAPTKAAEAPAAERDADGAIPPEPVDEETGEILDPPATQDQLDRIKAQTDARGITDKDVVLADISGYLAKFIKSPAILTAAEADVVLANIDTIWPGNEAAA